MPPSAAAPPWIVLAASPSVVRRAAKVAAVVGTALLAINHGDAIVAGDVAPGRLLRMGLTVLVPYLVSTFSSVAALREAPPAPAPVAVDTGAGPRRRDR